MSKRKPVNERFWAHVSKEPLGSDECWLWTSATVKGGYGLFFLTRAEGTTLAHRYAFELLVGPIPEGYELHHTCGTEACVRPGHLLPLTPAEHAALHPHASKGALNGAARSNLRKDACKHGHPFTQDNTYWRNEVGTTGRRWRMCRTCQREASVRQSSARKRQRDDKTLTRTGRK